MSKTYTCATCSVPFTRGRGRPPVVPLCPEHEVKKVVAERKPAPKPAQKPVVKEPVVKPDEQAAPEVWGGGSSAITRPCPNCGYAYADGGYCPECGWSLPINRLPYGVATGRTFKRG